MADKSVVLACRKWCEINFTAHVTVKVSLVPQETIPGNEGLHTWYEYPHKKPFVTIQILDSLDNKDACIAVRHEWAHIKRHLVGDVVPIKKTHDPLFKRFLRRIERLWKEDYGES